MVLQEEGEREEGHQGMLRCVPVNMNVLLLLLSRFSCVRLCATPQTADYQSPLSMGFSRQAYWSGVPLPSPLRDEGNTKETI